MSVTHTHDLLAEIEELPELLPLPGVALTLLNASKDPNIGARELSQIVSSDTSLSVRLLRASNSSLYGAGGITTIEHASVVLGARGLRDLAIAVVASNLHKEGKSLNPSSSSLWKHSLGCATVARTIAQNIDDVCPDEAFVTGIVHDLGKLVLIQLLRDQYTLIPRALDGETTTDAELELYGVCHTELGRRCAEQWGLPGEIAAALQDHHAEYDASVHSRLTAVVFAANQLSKIWRIGTDTQVTLDPQEVSAATDLPFDDQKLSEVQQQAAADYVQNQIAF